MMPGHWAWSTYCVQVCHAPGAPTIVQGRFKGSPCPCAPAQVPPHGPLPSCSCVSSYGRKKKKTEKKEEKKKK